LFGDKNYNIVLGKSFLCYEALLFYLCTDRGATGKSEAPHWVPNEAQSESILFHAEVALIVIKDWLNANGA
jgi:hypothetical protein